jgi:environmental stress-induced protein Ves
VKIVTLIHADEVTPQRWRNGGGWTRELLTWPADTDPWQLRISLATINAPGPFSTFPGVKRVLALVSGAGLLLTVDGHQHRLVPDSAPLHFDGSAVVQAVPLAGASIDLNLMSASGHGELLRAASASAWLSASTQRGLYSSVAGTLHTAAGGAGAPVAVPANSLIWLSQAANLPLHFVPEAAAPSLPAWWLGYSAPV